MKEEQRRALEREKQRLEAQKQRMMEQKGAQEEQRPPRRRNSGPETPPRQADPEEMKAALRERKRKQVLHRFEL